MNAKPTIYDSLQDDAIAAIGQGSSGYSGYSGYSGAEGASGYSGADGVSGYSGYSGIDGLSGYSGIDGASGLSGYSGESGYSGASGESGYSGESGVSGFSGESGYSGASGAAELYKTTTLSGVDFNNPGASINLGVGNSLAYIPGDIVRVQYSGDPVNVFLIGTVTAYNPGTGSIDISVTYTNGGGAWSGLEIIPIGMTGISGYSGYSGTSGYSGESGASGYSGELGTSGYSGESGASGYSGYSGLNVTVNRATFVDGDLSTGVLTVTHNLGLSAPYSVIVNIFDNTGLQVAPDSVTGSTNSFAVNLTSKGTLTGTWGYIYIA